MLTWRSSPRFRERSAKANAAANRALSRETPQSAGFCVNRGADRSGSRRGDLGPRFGRGSHKLLRALGEEVETALRDQLGVH